MVSFLQLWLPILLSGVFVFIASSVLNMVFKFWHMPDYRGFSNEDEISAAIRSSGASAGLYTIPHCSPESIQKPETLETFRQGPIAKIFLHKAGEMNMGTYLVQWFLFCLLVAIFCACLAAHALMPGAAFAQVFYVIGIAAVMGYGFGSLPNAIWWSHPWPSAIKYLIDGVIYGLITGATFAWLWPK